MSEICIYKAEASIEGLADKIVQSNVIAYTSQLVPLDDVLKAKLCNNVDFNKYSKSGLNDSDLYYTKSVLVTTNWNKNDDVFDRIETWAARHTPTHKPTNIEHNAKQLVGHITDCWAMTLEGAMIPDNILIDDLPNIYHLVNGAVIYRRFGDTDMMAQAEELIAQIEAGKKFVSMECTFNNFNYAIIKANNESNIIDRNENTAWMTKHLRAYGGTGEYDGYKIGRLLKNITFCGKGYVDKPANPNSIIFNSDNMFDFIGATAASQKNPHIYNNGVCYNSDNSSIMENSNMSNELDILKDQLEEVKATLKTTLDAKIALEEKFAQADVVKFEARIAELEKDLVSANERVEATKQDLVSVQAQVEEKDKHLQTLTEANTDLTKQLGDITASQILTNRISTLVDGGIAKDIAEQKASLYVNLNNDQWTDLSTDLIEAAKKKMTKEEESKEEDKKEKKTQASDDNTEDDADVNTDASILDDATLDSKPDLTVNADENLDETAEMRKELQKVIASRLGIKNEENTNE
jgi:hypothetical protein